MKLDFTEITKMVCLLARHYIPFELRADPVLTDFGDDYATAGLQVIIKDEETSEWIIDAVCNCASYGHERGLIEVMAHNGYEHITNHDVIGYLVGEEAFGLMEEAYTLSKNKRN